MSDEVILLSTNVGNLIFSSNLEVVVRPYNRGSLTGSMRYQVSSVAVHPSYSYPRLANNIAVLRTADPISLDLEVNAACFPQCQGMFDFIFANGTGTR